MASLSAEENIQPKASMELNLCEAFRLGHNEAMANLSVRFQALQFLRLDEDEEYFPPGKCNPYTKALKSSL